jgi:hypothetical protein
VTLVRLVAGAGGPQTVLTAPTGTEDMGAAANYLDTVRPTGQPAFGLNVREVYGAMTTYTSCPLVPLTPVILVGFLVWRRRRRR